MAKWVLDPAHSLVEFSIRHLMISQVKGHFSGVEGTLEAELNDLTRASVNVSVDVNTIDTREAQRDGHLKSADFFEAEKYPTMTFVSTSFVKKGDNEYSLNGTLTIHGVTKQVTFDLTYEGSGKDPWGNERAGFSATAKINRKDYGLNWNAALETGGVLVGEQVKIEIQIEAIKQAPVVA